MITARSRQLIEHPMCQAAECAAVATVAIIDAHSAESLCKAHHDAKTYREYAVVKPVEPEREPDGLF